MHFCQGLPIILVGCKKDLRFDSKTIEELRKTSQRPVTPEEVIFRVLCPIRTLISLFLMRNIFFYLILKSLYFLREWELHRKSAHTSIWNVQPKQARASVRYSNMPHGRLFWPKRRDKSMVVVYFCRLVIRMIKIKVRTKGRAKK